MGPLGSPETIVLPSVGTVNLWNFGLSSFSWLLSLLPIPPGKNVNTPLSIVKRDPAARLGARSETIRKASTTSRSKVLPEGQLERTRPPQSAGLRHTHTFSLHVVSGILRVVPLRKSCSGKPNRAKCHCPVIFLVTVRWRNQMVPNTSIDVQMPILIQPQHQLPGGN